LRYEKGGTQNQIDSRNIFCYVEAYVFGLQMYILW